MRNFDLSLYALFDPSIARGMGGEAVIQAVEGGVSLVQLRVKDTSSRQFLENALMIRSALASQTVPLIINDRVDIALACGADGVHLGQDDLPVEAARRIMGDEAIIGLTVRSEEEALRAPLDVIDYVGLGGVFATTSKANDTPPLGLDGFRHLASLLKERRPDLPICAIAGITPQNCGAVIKAGADGVAVISALFAKENPRLAAAEMLAAIESARA